MTLSTRSLHPWCLLVCSLPLWMPLSALAQATEEMLVQSGRLAQKQFDAPASVSVIDGQAIRNAGPQVNLSEALASAPGVVALNRNNYAQDVQISIRGFGARAAFGLRGIRLITDGIPATIPDGQGQASTVALTSAERIEVLTGPLAQLYGNSAGGVIQTFTRVAGPQPEADVSTTLGSNGLRRNDVQLSGRSGKVGIVADYSEFSTDGWRANSAAQRKQFNGVLTADLQDSTRVKVIANAFDMPEAQDPLGLTSAQLQDDPRQAGKNAIAHRTRKSVQQNQIGAVLEQRLNTDMQLQMRAYTGTRENLQYQAGNTSNAPLQGSWVGLSRDFSGLGIQLSGQQRDVSHGRVDWTLGTDMDQSAEQRQGGLTLSGEKNGAINRNELNKASNRDAFAQVQWHVQDAQGHNPFTLTAGLRHSDVRLSSRDDMPVTSSDPDGSGKVSYQASSPVLGITWHALDTLNLYANWGKGFETPTLAEAAYILSGSGSSRALKGQFNPDLLASHSQHREVGLKWTPNPVSRLQATLFDIRTRDEIVASLSDAGKAAYVNAGRTTRQGAELSWQSQWAPQWRSLFSAAWLQAAYNDPFTSTVKTGTSYNDKSVPAGNRLPGIPEKQLFASLQWAAQGFASAGRSGPLGLSSNLDWVARSALWASDMNDALSRAPGYGVLNFKLRHRSDWGPARIEAWTGVDNVTNRAYVGSVIVNQASGQYFEPGLPRNWAAGLRLSIPL